MEYYMEPPHYRPRESLGQHDQNPSEIKLPESAKPSSESKPFNSKLTNQHHLLLSVSALVNLGVTGIYWLQNRSKLYASDVGTVFLIGFYADLAWNTWKINYRRLRRAQKLVGIFNGFLFQGIIGYFILAVTGILKALLEGTPSEIVGHIQTLFFLAAIYIVLMITFDLLDGFLHGFIGDSEGEKRARKHFFRSISH